MSTRIIGLVFVLALGQILSRAQSVTVNYNGGHVAGAPTIVTDQAGTPIPDGNQVEIGYFDSSFSLQNNAGNLAALAAAHATGGAWHSFGLTNITSNFGILGFSAGSFSASASHPPADGFTGHQIDLWIFQTPNGAAPDAAFDNVTAWGLFSSTVNVSPSQTWTFPAASIGGVDNISTLDVSVVSGILYHGALTSAGDLEVTGVPEPSTVALFGLGLGTLVVFARRTQQKSN